MGEGDQLDYRSKEAQKEGGTNTLLFTVFIGPKGYCYTYMMSCCVLISMKFSLGLSSSKVECRKWVREINETIVVKKPKMEEGPMPYYL
ncbi:hypothetical protein IEQ34_000799 [Dendrobium chrysotoxum]|uniref:Uncharacterized protein n=1 Tax=Dendrobium chrysotoxum TaxID=161865 RepID=A0AAV7HPJ1_DENCH|nr:hypothetical protein IEQ34_000799 [Dendrobium chrysotoxum]